MLRYPAVPDRPAFYSIFFFSSFFPFLREWRCVLLKGCSERRHRNKTSRIDDATEASRWTSTPTRLDGGFAADEMHILVEDDVADGEEQSARLTDRWTTERPETKERRRRDSSQAVIWGKAIAWRLCYSDHPSLLKKLANIYLFFPLFFFNSPIKILLFGLHPPYLLMCSWQFH